jgi:hypothetical protein
VKISTTILLARLILIEGAVLWPVKA